MDPNNSALTEVAAPAATEPPAPKKPEKELPTYHTLHTLAQAVAIDRGVLERMTQRGVISPDAYLPHGRKMVPLFLQAREGEVITKRIYIESAYRRLPQRCSPRITLRVPKYVP